MRKKIFKIKAFSRFPKLCVSLSNFTKTPLTAEGKASEFVSFTKELAVLHAKQLLTCLSVSVSFVVPSFIGMNRDN